MRALDPGLAAVIPLTVVREDDTRRAEILARINEVARSGAFTLGDEVERFEREFAAVCGSRRCVGVSSGTDALVLALRALGVGPGDEVIVPANSFIATAEAVSLVGARPRFVDVDPFTHLVTPETIAAGIGPDTRGIIVVHLMGATVDMAAITELAAEHELFVVEDTAQAHGAVLGGRQAGTIGDIGCFSFYPTKNLGAWGDGGAVVTDDEELADRVRLLRCHGERPRYHHRMVGTTARLDAVQAAVLRVKLRDLDAVTDRRRRLGWALLDGLRDAGVELVSPSCPEADHVFHLFVVRSDARDDLREHLARRGVSTAVHYPVPIHLTAAYADHGLLPGSLPVAESLAQRICTLPLFPGMTSVQVTRVVDAVKSFTEGETR